MDDLDLLRKAARDNPGEDVPLLMLADELRTRGDDRCAAEAETAVAMRAFYREVEAFAAGMAAAVAEAVSAAISASERAALALREQIEAAVRDANGR